MNSIINQNLGEGNSIPSLSFSWKAFFSDGYILEQFENKIEHKFKEIKDNFDKLTKFSLVNKDYSKCFTVDLKNGFIIYNNFRNINTDQIGKKENIRLIYFRRHQVEISEKGQELSHKIEYYLGLQWLDSNRNNRKIVLIIDSEGNFIIEE